MSASPRIALLLLYGVLVACQRTPTATPATVAGATRPAQAVQLLTRHLRENDLRAFARDAVPPALHAQIETAWRDGRTRWPLDELPFANRLPMFLQSLAADGSQARLQQTFDHQFAGETAQLKSVAISLGLFGGQYIQREGHYSAAERQHYAQLIQAVSRWGLTAPLADRERARVTITQLTIAAKRTGLASPADFRTAGMEGSLRRMDTFAGAFKRAVARYGLDLDASLDGMQATLQQQTGDTAQVRMRYRVGDADIDTIVPVQRIDGRWYISDYLQHARAAVGPSGR
ncbi:MAG: hypothetical protein ABIP11_01725 [Luteimonas sp.]